MDNQFDNQNNPQPNTDTGAGAPVPENNYGQTPENQNTSEQPANPYTTGGQGPQGSEGTGPYGNPNPQNNPYGGGAYNGGYSGNAVPPNPGNNYQYNTGGYQEENPKSGMATASLVLGIISAVLLCCFAGFNIIPAIVAIILGFLSKGGAQKLSGNAKAGIIISIVVIVLTIILIIVFVVAFADVYNDPEFYNILQKAIEESQNLILF